MAIAVPFINSSVLARAACLTVVGPILLAGSSVWMHPQRSEPFLDTWHGLTLYPLYHCLPCQVRILETETGMVVWPQLMSPLDFGSRGERRRWHILAWNKAWLAPAFLDQIARDRGAFAQHCQDVLALCRQPKQALHNFMLSDRNPSLQQWLQARPAQATTERSGTSWQIAHQEAARVLGVAWPIEPARHPTLATMPTGLLQSLTARQREALFLYVLKHVPDLVSEKRRWHEEDSDLFLDVSQSWGRVPSRRGCCPTFLPRSIPVTLGQSRLLTPLEVARFHGWDTEAHPFAPLAIQDHTQKKGKRKSSGRDHDTIQARAAFTWTEVMDLFGNSFNGYTTVASLIVGLLHLQGPGHHKFAAGKKGRLSVGDRS